MSIRDGIHSCSELSISGVHPCGQEDRGGCSHLCLPTRDQAYRCACPSFGGLALSFNAKTCEGYFLGIRFLPGVFLFQQSNFQSSTMYASTVLLQ